MKAQESKGTSRLLVAVAVMAAVAALALALWGVRAPSHHEHGRDGRRCGGDGGGRAVNVPGLH